MQLLGSALFPVLLSALLSTVVITVNSALEHFKPAALSVCAESKGPGRSQGWDVLWDAGVSSRRLPSPQPGALSASACFAHSPACRCVGSIYSVGLITHGTRQNQVRVNFVLYRSSAWFDPCESQGALLCPWKHTAGSSTNLSWTSCVMFLFLTYKMERVTLVLIL